MLSVQTSFRPLIRVAFWIAFTAGSVAIPVAVQAQTSVSVYEEQAQRIRAPKAVAALGPELFGDTINLYNGQLSFQQTDVDLKGNNGLPVSVGRRISTGQLLPGRRSFGRWELDIPHMHGLFAESKQWPGSSLNSMARCSDFGTPPPAVGGIRVEDKEDFDAAEFWQGSFMYIPGHGDQMMLARAPGNVLVPGAVQDYPIVTSRFWAISCLQTIKNGPGEGFLAVSPEGTRYYFDWFAPFDAFSLRKATLSTTGAVLPRKDVWLLPSQVVDRFGNRVTYTYDPARPQNLLRIEASDGRVITFGYGTNGQEGLVQSVSDGTRTWRYHYSAAAIADLQAVTLPDNTTWDFANFNSLLSGLNFVNNGTCGTLPLINSSALTGTIRHPTGAVGTFTLTPTIHGRSRLSQTCQIGDAQSPDPRYFGTLSLTSKAIGGPGIGVLGWTYDYGPRNESWDTCQSCPTTKTVTVTDPDRVVSRYTFGNRHRVSEGRLELTETGWNGTTAERSVSQRYRLYPGVQGYSDATVWGDSELDTHLAPVDQRITTQQGVAFTWQANGFNAFAQPTEVVRSSILGATGERMSYKDELVKLNGPTKWVLNQILSVTHIVSGKEMARNEYNETTSTLKQTWKFGLPVQSMTYFPDGSLATRADGLGQTTRYFDYMRGIPRRVEYPTGAVEKAEVSNIGTILSIGTNVSTADPDGFVTRFGYDGIGRLQSITYPDEPDQHWNATTIDLIAVQATDFDLEPGHWRQDVKTGNGVTSTYLDALWRPVYTLTYDAANFGNTAEVTRQTYDSASRVTFSSYPRSSGAALGEGVHTEYNTLGQPLRVWADSELGPLTTYHYYQPGFQHTSVDPRGKTTTRSFQAFDTPSESAAARIWAPEGLEVSIDRDVFGTPKSISRGGNGKTAMRRYVYDQFQRLCKTIEPETGAEIVEYDAASNISWRAPGLALTSEVCDRTAVPQAGKISFTYDKLNRLMNTTFGDGAPAIARTYTADGLPETVVSSGASWTHTYNKRRLNKTQVLNFGAQNYTISNSYDANGHLAQLAYPGENNPIAVRSVDYAPDGLGRPSRVGGFATDIRYHPGGAIAGFIYGNGKAHQMAQNLRNLPELSSDAGVLHDRYRYDENGNVASITDELEGIGTRTMGYDGLDRLITANAPGIWGNAGYTYDVLDNIATSVVGSRMTTYGYNSRNLLEQLSSTAPGFSFAYGYDNRGNVTTRGGQTFNFDLGNRLRSAPNKSTYVYDGYGRRVQTTAVDGTVTLSLYSADGKLLYTKRTSGPGPAQHTEYIYLHQHQIAEVTQ